MTGNRLAELRQAADLSQTALAYERGVTSATVYRWEKERTGIPDEHKVALASRFGVTVAYLMRWDDPEPVEPVEAAA